MAAVYKDVVADLDYVLATWRTTSIREVVLYPWARADAAAHAKNADADSINSKLLKL